MNTKILLGVLMVMILYIAQAQMPQSSNQQTDQVDPDSPPNPDHQARKVQVALILDTSNSMDGLIEQAKSRLWDIVNTLGTIYYRAHPVNIEIALYEYGNDRLNHETNYIRLVQDFTHDLDMVSEKLFGLQTLGGEEYCGAVLQNASKVLKWSPSNEDIKLIYIAGNESFAQGPISYTEVLRNEISKKDIQVNTIFCGKYQEGVNIHWSHGAQLAHGKYFAINSDDQVRHIATPYDDSILYYNHQLNDTYIAYGVDKDEKKEFMLEQDNKAARSSKETMTKRAISKSKKSVYKNQEWDMVDAYEEAPESIQSIPENQLPDEMIGMTETEKKKYVEKKHAQRNQIQKKISALNKERNQYVQQERSKSSSTNNDDFGMAVVQSIESIAKQKGYELKN